jgi:hypothetical protein
MTRSCGHDSPAVCSYVVLFAVTTHALSCNAVLGTVALVS